MLSTNIFGCMHTTRGLNEKYVSSYIYRAHEEYTAFFRDQYYCMCQTIASGSEPPTQP
jgi:hypothetical protein